MPPAPAAHLRQRPEPTSSWAPREDGTEPEFAGTSAEIAASLRKDPVLVQELVGNGRTAEIDEALTAKAAALDFPVYVALVQNPRDISADPPIEDLTALLHAELGDGVYVVGNGYQLQLEFYGELAERFDNGGVTLSLARYDSLDAVRAKVWDGCEPEDCYSHPAAEAAVILDLLAQDPDATVPLSDADVAAYTTPMWVHRKIMPPYEGDAGFHSGVLLTAILATMALVVGVPVLYRFLQALGASTPPDPDQPRIEEVRADAHRQISKARDARSRRLRQDPTAAGAEESGEQLERAERLVTSKDLLDVVGALVLARTARATLKGQRHLSCYYHPLHTGPVNPHSVGGGLTVPACDSCRARVQTDQAPRALIEVRRRRPDVPYYQGNTVWARTGFGAFDPHWWQEVGR